jgi:hypothetical protein
MPFTQPTLHHILYIESDTVQIAKYGFLRPIPRSIWVLLEYESEREALEQKLAQLHKTGIIKLYVISACSQDDEYIVEDVYELLGSFDRWPFGASYEANS